MDRERRDYTPTKLSKLTNITTANNNNPSALRTGSDLKSNLSFTRQEYSKVSGDYGARPIGSNEMSLLKDYQLLKMQVRQMQSQNRQLSNQVETLKYEKNVHQTRYHQKVSSEEDTIAQFQKEKNYQVGLIKLKSQEEVNRLKREYEYRLDDLQRELRNRDYHNRQGNEKNSYLELKINELNKGIDVLEIEHAKLKEANAVIKEHLNREQFNKNKLLSITEQLEKQKSEMEAEIHVLLDIEAQKSRNINTMESQCRNSEAVQRSLHQKLTLLTENFAQLEEHIAVMKERLISTDARNQQLERQLSGAECKLSNTDQTVMLQKDLENQVRRELEINQQREVRRERQLEKLVQENQRLVNEANLNRQKLHDLCITQGIEV